MGWKPKPAPPTTEQLLERSQQVRREARRAIEQAREQRRQYQALLNRLIWSD